MKLGILAARAAATALVLLGAAPPPAALAAYQPPTLAWTHAIYGSNIGGAGLAAADIDGDGAVEIVAGGSSGGGFGRDDFWYVLREGAVADTYAQVWTSPRYADGIVAIAVADADANGVSEIYVALPGGTVEVRDGAAPDSKATIATGLSLLAMEVADADGDGAPDLLLTDGTALSCRALAPPYAQKWSLAAAGGTAIAVGQVDADAAPEIVVSQDAGNGNGLVIDGATRATQWTYANGFGATVRCGDVDADGRDEIVAAAAWYRITAFDAEIRSPKWEIPISGDIGAMRLEHTDADAVPEVVVGEGQWGNILCFDAATRLLRWDVANPYHGVTEVEVADVNGDGALEVLWGAGATDTGPDALFVADVAERLIEWQSPLLDGPLAATGAGDVDGDGAPEVVMISWSSESGYDDGIIHVFDGATRALEWTADSAPGTYDWMGVRKVVVGNVDDDPRDEIVYTSANIYDGKVAVFDGSTQALKRASAGYDGNYFSALALADVDGDGAVEVVAGQGREHTGAAGVSIVVFDGATMAEEWKSIDLGIYSGYVSDIAVGCVDGDGNPEIVAAMPGGKLYVFDGVTHQLDWLAAMDAESVEIADVDGDGAPEILVGRTGAIEAYDGATHALEASRPIGTTAVVALRLDRVDAGVPWFFASDGSRLHHFAWGAATSWRSPVLGTSVAWHDQIVLGDVDADGGREMLAGSSYALYLYDFGQVPDAPTNVAATSGTHRDRIVVSWDAAAGAGEYLVSRAEVGGEFSPIGTAPGGATSFEDPALCASGPLRYRVQASSAAGTSLPSDEATGETAACALALTAPNGGERWRQGTACEITWTGQEGTGTAVAIELWSGGAIDRILAAGTPNDGSFTWRIPSWIAPRPDYAVRVVPVRKLEAADASDAAFEIALPRITLRSPNGGETWRLGTTKTIRWTSLGTAGKVRIELLRRGALVQVISPGTADDGSFPWLVPTTLAPARGYTVRVTARANPAVGDSSDAPFTLAR